MKNNTEKKVRPRWGHWAFHFEVDTAAPEKVLRRFNKSQAEFDIAFMEDILATNPNHLDTMRVLAELYTLNGQHRQGLEIDLRLSRACPRDPVVHYNLACSLSLVHRVSESLQALKRAIQLGYRDYEHMFDDPDLESARHDTRWAELFSFTEV